MMNITIVSPRPGYLERVRELTARARHRAGLRRGQDRHDHRRGRRGRALRREPDVVCLAKAIAGGYPSGAVGMTETLADLITSGNVRQVGTFNGNPLSMAAAQAALTEVLTDDAYAGFEALDARLRAGLDDVIERYGLPCHTVGLGSKGCVVFSSEPLYEYRDYATKVDEELSTLAVAVPHEPRHLHDPGRRRAVDAERRAQPMRSCSATSTPSRRLRAM